ncbi:MAG TPA: tetratricopeptide repeat protein [Myxococcus sp.]|nr:tetratricopeptide repeat protein [Myxococcus sp.]
MRMRFGVLAVLLAVLGACRSSGEDARRAAESARREGIRHYKAGDYALAEAAFTEELKHDPASSDASIRRGGCRMKLGDLPGAEADFAESIRKLTRFEPDPHALLALVQIERGNPRAALEGLDAALQQGAGDVHLLITRARARMLTGDAKGALSDVESAKSPDPKSAPAWALHGMYLAASGRESEAIAQLEKAAALAPEDPWAALWLLALGRGDALLQQARPVKPWQQQLVKFALGTLSWEALQEEARRPSIERERADRISDAHTTAGLVAEGRGQPAEASRHYRAVVEAGLTHTNMHTWATSRLSRLQQ